MRNLVMSLIAGAALLLIPAGTISAQSTQRITLIMGDFYYKPNRMTLQVGVPAEITLVNRGNKQHEFMVYTRPRPGMSGRRLHDWAEEQTYFKGMTVEVPTAPGVKAEYVRNVLVEVMVGAGKTAVLRFTPTRTGTFEMACLIKGHYEAGQKGTFVVR